MATGSSVRPYLFLRKDMLTIPLNGESGVVGRAPETADVVVDSMLVSRRHATWRRVSDDAIEVQDLGSANGTFLEGERLDQTPVTVRIGQRIDFGSAGALMLSDQPTQSTTHVSGARGLACLVHEDGSVEVEVRVESRALALFGGKRAELLFVLARQLERDVDLEAGQRGWMERVAIVRRLYGRSDAGSNRFYKLLHDTRAALERQGLSLDAIESRGTRMRLREPEGGIQFRVETT